MPNCSCRHECAILYATAYDDLISMTPRWLLRGGIITSEIRPLPIQDRINNPQSAKPPTDGLGGTTMSRTLPPEILDLIIDYLHDQPTALKSCCVVSKSWLPRTRGRLFARVEFDTSKSHIDLWKKTFPDLSNSPAHHTRSLSICGAPIVTAADAGGGGWIRTFHNVVDLRLSHLDRASLVPFYGLSPTLRSLHLIHTHSNVFDLVCSFPLLEDLELDAVFPEGDADGWNIPLTSPRLTGTLDLRTLMSTRLVIRRLLGLPGGLHFSRINAIFLGEDTKSMTDLVSKCSDTLEFLTILRCPSGAFLSTPVTS